MEQHPIDKGAVNANKAICFFISSISEAGGTGRVCALIANELVERGYNVTILSFYGKDTFFKLHSAVKTVMLFNRQYAFKLMLPYVVFKIRKQLLKIKPDILINVDTALFPYSHYSSLGMKIKNVAWEHFNFNVTLNAQVRKFGRQLAAKNAACIVTLTEKDKQNWLNNLICKGPVIAINNPSSFRSGAIDFDKKENIALAVGRLTYQKGFERLIDTWSIIKEKAPAGWKLCIVGSGELKTNLQDQIERLLLNSDIEIIPATSQIQEYYLNASIYCMTSLFEGFPMVLLEAQNYGLPLVSFDCETGPAEIIRDNGFLVKDNDKEAFANAVLKLINSKELRQEMGERSLQNAKNYTIDSIINHWIALFNSI